MSLNSRSGSDHQGAGRLRHLSGNARSGPPSDPRAPSAPPPPPKWRSYLLPIGVALTLLLLLKPQATSTPKSLSYSQFLAEINANKVTSASIGTAGQVTGTLVGGSAYTSQIPTALSDTSLPQLLEQHKVDITGAAPAGTTLAGVIISLLPFALFLGFFLWIGRRSQKQLAGGIMGFGGAKAKLYDEDRPSTRFADIAGYEGSK
jgi:cell division protease FtsH